MLSTGLPAAYVVLRDALGADEPSLRAAVMSMLAHVERPPLALLEGALRAYVLAPAESLETDARVLARFGEPAVESITARLQDAGLPEAVHARLALALGEFRLEETARPAAEVLMGLIAADGSRPDAVRAAAFEGLRRLTGRTHAGDDARDWIQWWERLRDRPAEEWLSSEVGQAVERQAALQRQVDSLQRQLDQSTALAQKLQKRLADALAQIYLAYPEDADDARLERLAAWLDEDLPTVRRVAILRVDRLVRTGDPLSPDIEAGLVRRVADAEPDIRALAVQLLDLIDHPETSRLATTALAQETDPATANKFLEILTRRPNAEAVSGILAMTSDPARSDAAVRALLAAVEHLPAEAVPTERVREAARAAYERQATPTTVKLLARVGSDEDAAAVEPLLAGGDAALKQAAAEGFAARPSGRAILLRHASDPTIYPAAVQALTNAPAGPASFRRLLETPPPTLAGRDVWVAGLTKVASGLAAAELVAADALVAELASGATSENSPQIVDSSLRRRIRESILAPVLALPPDRLTPDHMTLLTRLAEVRLADARPEAALEALARVNGSAPAEPKNALRFEAMLRLGRFDDAAGVYPAAEAWLRALERWSRERPESLPTLAAEIRRRFPDARHTLLALSRDIGEHPNPPDEILAGENEEDDGSQSTNGGGGDPGSTSGGTSGGG